MTEAAGSLARGDERGAGAPAVSVVVPAYNVARYIAGALDSVFAQTFEDYEVIVINDGSPDTPELEHALEPYRGRLIYLRQENGGVSAARNAGIRAARGEFVAHLDPDDLWEPEYLAAQLEALGRDPAVDVLYPNALIFGDAPEAGREFMDWCPSEGEVTVEALLRQRCHVMCSVTARREALVRAGLFDEGLRCSEDFDLWLRVLKGGGRIAYQRRVLVRYRRHAASHTADFVWLNTSLLRVLDKAERTLELTPGEREALEGMRRHARATLELNEGKRAFFRGDARVAVASLSAANAYFKSRRIACVVLLMRLSPKLLRRAYDARDRFVWRADTKF
ncbi:MAG: glycosyltransferase [Acidobacteria bacterium]|nr:glycosyltransferase [Acidobacteriota bacterium]